MRKEERIGERIGERGKRKSSSPPQPPACDADLCLGVDAPSTWNEYQTLELPWSEMTPVGGAVGFGTKPDNPAGNKYPILVDFTDRVYVHGTLHTPYAGFSDGQSLPANAVNGQYDLNENVVFSMANKRSSRNCMRWNGSGNPALWRHYAWMHPSKIPEGIMLLNNFELFISMWFYQQNDPGKVCSDKWFRISDWTGDASGSSTVSSPGPEQVLYKRRDWSCGTRNLCGGNNWKNFVNPSTWFDYTEIYDAPSSDTVNALYISALDEQARNNDADFCKNTPNGIRPFLWGLDNSITGAFYMSDIYSDFSLARIEIANSTSLWSGPTHKEMQIPYEWDNQTVRVILNRGSLPNFAQSGYYLRAINSAGQVAGTYALN